MIRCVSVLAILILCGCATPKNENTIAVNAQQSAIENVPHLLPGIYEASGELGYLESLQVEIKESQEFIAKRTWRGVHSFNLFLFSAEIRGRIKSPEKDIIVFSPSEKDAFWPFGEKFTALSNTELRTYAGYLKVMPGGRLEIPPDSTAYLYLKKVVRPATTL